MYLIKCSKCNNLIEVKTEFLMICPKCKARLENSFQMWHQQKENRDKNFTNYLDEVCVSSEQIEERQRQERRTGHGNMALSPGQRPGAA